MHLSWLDPHKMRRITVVGREKMVVFDDMELERKVTIYEKGRGSRPRPTASGRRGPATSTARRSRPTSRCGSSASTSCARRRRGRPAAGRAGRRRGRARARAAQASLVAAPRVTEIAETAIVYPGTVVGEGCRILDYAVVGKQPTLSPRSTASARGAAAARARRRDDRLDGSRRLRRDDDRRAGDRRRPGVRAGALRRSATTWSSAAARWSRTTRPSARGRRSRPTPT